MSKLDAESEHFSFYVEEDECTESKVCLSVEVSHRNKYGIVKKVTDHKITITDLTLKAPTIKIEGHCKRFSEELIEHLEQKLFDIYYN